MKRTSIIVDRDKADSLVQATGAKSKTAAVHTAIDEYLRRVRVQKIRSLRGKLQFDRSADQVRHHER